MSLTNLKTMKSERGFTIVELLIVIVIIGILAAIVIVAYNGITNRAKASKAQTAATTFIKKAEAFNAETGAYPVNFSDLAGATATKSYYLSGVTLSATAITAAPTNENTINAFTCASGAPDTTHIYAVQYWDYSTGAISAKQYFGGASSSSTCATLVAS